MGIYDMIFSAYKHILSYYFSMSSKMIFVKNGEFSYETTPIKGTIQRKNGKKQTFMPIIEI